MHSLGCGYRFHVTSLPGPPRTFGHQEFLSAPSESELYVSLIFCYIICTFLSYYSILIYRQFKVNSTAFVYPFVFLVLV